MICDEVEDIVGGGITKTNNPTLDKLIPETVSACSLTAAGSDGVCSSDAAIAAMAKIAGNTGGTTDDITEQKKKIVADAANALGCSNDSELCVISSNEFKAIYGTAEAKKEIANNFKINGPTDTSLLNNVNIDKTLKQWEHAFGDTENKFFAYNFNMKNYKEYNDTLATVKMRNLYKSGYKTFGCVINSDTYSGRGKHWMALFGDLRGPVWSVEFFNSAGRAPAAEFAEWLISSKQQLEEIIAEEKLNNTVTIIKCDSLEHQKSKTECGVYSLYYIYARINGAKPQDFIDTAISDVVCFEFRQHLFYDNSRPAVSTFEFDQFKGSAKVQWEDDVSGAEIKRIESGQMPTKLIHAQRGKKTSGVTGGRAPTDIVELNYESILDFVECENAHEQCYVGCGSKKNSNPFAGLSREQIYNSVLTTAAEKAELAVSVDFSLFLDLQSARTLQYRKLDSTPPVSLHWGQLKLLMCEIAFISLYAQHAQTILYIGAAPGTHIKYLVKLFPKHKFILYDPRDFTLSPSSAVEIHQEYFTIDTARKYVCSDNDVADSTKNILFISDIRTNPDCDSVEENMNLQHECVKIMNPYASSLKFRLRYVDSIDDTTATTKYLAGKIFIQPWAPQVSTETRLFVERKDKCKLATYSNYKYESAMFRHNFITRQFQTFPTDPQLLCNDGLCTCYDCAATLQILRDYLATTSIEITNNVLIKMIKEFCNVINKNRSLVSPPHGMYCKMPMQEKYHLLYQKFGDVIISKFLIKQMDRGF